jgi:hypothetical protein
MDATEVVAQDTKAGAMSVPWIAPPPEPDTARSFREAEQAEVRRLTAPPGWLIIKRALQRERVVNEARLASALRRGNQHRIHLARRDLDATVQVLAELELSLKEIS